MTPQGPGAHPRWRVVAVADKDPIKFAAHLQEVLQECTDGGWQMTSREYRGESCIITMCRLEQATQGVRLPPPPPRRVITAEPKVSDVYQEVLYSFQKGPGGEVVTEKFDSLLGALRLLQEHLEHGDWPLPIKIVRCRLDIFEAKSIPALLKLYSRELQNGGHPN